jgi:hypothetical protein
VWNIILPSLEGFPRANRGGSTVRNKYATYAPRPLVRFSFLLFTQPHHHHTTNNNYYNDRDNLATRSDFDLWLEFDMPPPPPPPPSPKRMRDDDRVITMAVVDVDVEETQQASRDLNVAAAATSSSSSSSSSRVLKRPHRDEEDEKVMSTTTTTTTTTTATTTEMCPETIKSLLATHDRRGNAATIILRVVKQDPAADDEPVFVLQVKTEGYPYHTMIGSLCLFGGNREEKDKSARDTLLRECMEELPPAWCDEIERTLRPYSRFVVTASRDACAPKPFSYSFMCAVFEATLPYEIVAATDSKDVLEGLFTLKKLSELVGEATPTWCWGYDVVMTNYLRDVLFERELSRLPKFRTDYVRCEARRIAAPCRLSDEEFWVEQEEWR